MPGHTEPQGYFHRQQAPLCILLYATAVVLLAGGWWLRNLPPFFLLFPLLGGLLLILAASFHHLTVADRGTWLALRFGPLPLFRRTVLYADMESVETGRTLLLDGWGIHYSLRGGWVWNLWGRSCVVVRFKNGGRLRIGTDDPGHLAKFIEGKLAARPGASASQESNPLLK